MSRLCSKINCQIRDTVIIVMNLYIFFFFLLFKIEIKFTYHKIHSFKICNSVVLVYRRVVQPPQLSNSKNIFIVSCSAHPRHPCQKEPPYPLAATPHSPSLSSQQPLINFVFLWICLFSTFHVNRMIQNVAFCVWFLSCFQGSSMMSHIFLGLLF